MRRPLIFVVPLLAACGRIAFEHLPIDDGGTVDVAGEEPLPASPDSGDDASDAEIDASDAGIDASDAEIDASDAGIDASDAGIDASDASDDGVDAPADGASDAGATCLPWALGFSFVPEALDGLNTAAVEEKPRLARDGLTLYFTGSLSDTLGGFDIYMARRAAPGAPFDFVGHDLSASTPSYDDCLVISANGLETYVASNRPGSLPGGSDLWRATRASTVDPFGAFDLVPMVNTADDENDPFLSANGLRLYFASERFENPRDHLGVASRPTVLDAFDTIAPIAELSPVGIDQGNPTLTDDELLIVFNSTDGGSHAVYATRTAVDQPFGTPASVPGLPSGLLSPMVTPDGCEIFYAQAGNLYRATYAPP